MVIWRSAHESSTIPAARYQKKRSVVEICMAPDPVPWLGVDCNVRLAQGGANEGKLLATYKKGSDTQGSERRAVCVDGRCR